MGLSDRDCFNMILETKPKSYTNQLYIIYEIQTLLGHFDCSLLRNEVDCYLGSSLPDIVFIRFTFAIFTI